MNELKIYEDLLRLPGLKIDRILPGDRRIDIYGQVDEGPQSCPNCGEPSSQVNQYILREIRDLDMSGRQVWLHLEMKQYECVTCRRFFTQRLSWADPNKSYTRRQAKFIFEMCRHQSYSQVGAIVDMHAKSVERLFLACATKEADVSKRLRQVRRLGIDEISGRKGRGSYCCVLTDLDRGIHIDILPNRKKETLRAYFQRLGPQWCTQIEAVSCDMWLPYIEVAEEFFPEATISIDRFHVVMGLNKGLDTMRRKLRRKHPKESAFKTIKWQLYKRVNKLSMREKEQLELAFQQSEELRQMYELRNRFHEIFDQHSEHWTALEALNLWIKDVQQSVVAPLWKNFINTLTNWKGYILNYVDTRLTNAATEGLNNLIRHVKRISYGITNFEHLRLRVLARLE